MVLNYSEKKLNIRLIIEYDGQNYFGWQRQKSKPSIQSTIENSLQVLTKSDNITLTGAGRTDTGVHAYGQTANFLIEKEKLGGNDLNKFVRSLNSILPLDISVLKADIVPENFNSRYSAKKRVYIYLFSLHKTAVSRKKVYYYKNRFDIETAKEFCRIIEGRHSFRSLCKNKDDKFGFASVIEYARLKKRKDNIFEFEICGVRFLHSMVRAIIGAMFKVSSGNLGLIEFKNKFKNEKILNVQYVPAYALYLKKVIY